MSNKSEKKYTNEDLKEMQGWPLERKIQVSQTRILEFGLKFDKQIYVSFSGGKDSTVLLDLVRRVFPDTPAVFIDTGLEYPEIRDFVRGIDNVTWLKPRMNFRKVIETYGYPVVSKEVSHVIHDARTAIINGRQDSSYACQMLDGIYINKNNGKLSPYNKPKWKFLLDAPFKISHSCCDVMKKQTVHSYEKEAKRHPIIGTMASESRLRRSQWIINGCNAFNAKNPHSNPISFWTEQDVFEYLIKFNIPYCKIYGEILQDKNGKYYTTGLNRTGCMYCPFGAQLEKEPNRFQRLKVTHPKVWEFCMKPWDKGGLGMREVLEYIGVKTE